MKKAIKIGMLIIILMMVGCGTPGDPILDDLYTQDVLPGTDSEYTVGSSEYRYSEGWFDTLYANLLYAAYIDSLNVINDADIGGDTTLGGALGVEGSVTIGGNTTLYDQVILDDDGEIWLEFRVKLAWATVQAHGKPDHVTRGVFDGFSLPIWAADNEELYFEVCIPDRWMGPAWTYLQDVGDEPGAMAVYRGLLYIPCENDDTVWVYDGTTFSVSGTVGDDPVYAYTYDDNLYVTCGGDDTVWVFDGTTWSKSGDIGNAPEGMAEFEGDLYVACRLDDAIWRLSGGVWAVDPALGLGGVAGAVGAFPMYLAEYGGDLYVSCTQVDDDVWIRSAGAWAKDADVGGDPQEFHEHEGDLYLNCLSDDTVWIKSAGVWALFTNVMTTIGNAPIGLEEYDESLFSACVGSIWSDHHTIDADVVPFWNVNSDFSLVTADQPMFLKEYDDKLYCSAKVGDGIWVYEGETAKFTSHMWLTAAQVAVTDAYRVEIAHEGFTPCVDTVPTSEEEIVREVMVGIVPQFQSCGIHAPIDMTGHSQDDSMGIRLRRIASSDEIAGELVIQHVGMTFKCNKIGSMEP